MRHLSAKKEKDNTPKRLFYIAVSKVVNIKLRIIMATVLYDLHHLLNVILSALQCRDPNRLYQTVILFLFCHGNVMHTYSSGSFASEGVHKWIKHTQIKSDTAENVAMQMEGFAVLCLSKCIKTKQNGVYQISIL